MQANQAKGLLLKLFAHQLDLSQLAESPNIWVIPLSEKVILEHNWKHRKQQMTM